ncbi:MoxR family ATPase [bacterium]|nr:MoxR family ATPase [candidate division CSSED10-310 bacterium]
MESAWESIDRLQENIQKVIVGKQDVVELAVIALLSKGHLLIEDVPGVGKTTLARAIARSLECSFKRIQFTPDLLPSDVLGVSIYNQKTGEFRFNPGPIFANIVLADEINRASPRTQSGLLEAMSDFQVTVDRDTIDLPDPFLVIATQNPVEYEGTFPLPESQLDRFAMSIQMGSMTLEEEKRMVLDQRITHPLTSLAPVQNAEELLRLQEMVKSVLVSDELLEYLLKITAATRTSNKVILGASPRGSLVLYRCSQAAALVRHRDYVVPDDIKRIAVSVLAHRLILEPTARYSGETRDNVIRDILDTQRVPV